RRLLGGQPALQARGRLVQRRLQRLLACHVALGPAEGAQRIRQCTGQQLAEPCQQLLGRAAAKLVALAVGLQQGLLGEVGGVELALVVRAEVHAGQQAEVVAVALQAKGRVAGFAVHRCPPSKTSTEYSVLSTSTLPSCPNQDPNTPASRRSQPGSPPRPRRAAGPAQTGFVQTRRRPGAGNVRRSPVPAPAPPRGSPRLAWRPAPATPR